MLGRRQKIIFLWILLNNMSHAWVLENVLVYHELFAYEVNTDSNQRLRGTKLTPSETVALINDDLSHPQVNGMGSVINTVYGANSIPYWYSSSDILSKTNATTYLQWFNDMRLKLLNIGAVSKDDILYRRDLDIDNLIKHKLLGNGADLFLDLTPNNGDNLIASYRINDYHHLDTALAIKDKLNFKKDPYDNNRKLASISPEYMYFLDKGAVISRKRGFDEHHIGNIGDDKFCHDYPVLDMGNKDVLLHKKREVWRTLQLNTIGALEIDFTRSPCMFSKNLPIKERGRIIKEFLLFTINATSNKHFNKKLILRFPSYVDWSNDFGFNIRSFVAEYHSSIDAVISGAGVGLRARLPEPDPFNLISMRNKIRDKGGRINTRFYHQVSYLTDAYRPRTTSTKTIEYRRIISQKELRGISHLAKELGYDGIYLFNFYYIFGIQKKLAFNMSKRVSWNTLARLFDTEYLNVDNENQGKAYFISSKTNNLSFDGRSMLTVNKTLPAGNTFMGSSILLRVKTNEKTNIVLTVSINEKCKINMYPEKKLSALHPLEHISRDADSSTIREIDFWAGPDYVHTAWVNKECLNSLAQKNKFRFQGNKSGLKLEFMEILERNINNILQVPSPIKVVSIDTHVNDVSIKWDNSDYNVFRYTIYLNGNQVAALSPKNNSYSFHDLEENTTYHYELKAVNSKGNTTKKGSFKTKKSYAWLISIYSAVFP